MKANIPETMRLQRAILKQMQTVEKFSAEWIALQNTLIDISRVPAETYSNEWWEYHTER